MINNRIRIDDGTLERILKGKAIVQQRLEGQAHPDFFTRSLTDEDYIRIGEEGAKDIAPRTLGSTIKDVGVTAAKGIVGLGEAAVGIADIPTGGRVGKAMEDHIGYDAGATQAFLDTFYSDAQKGAFSEVEKAEGFWNTAKTMLDHPSTIAHALIESGPQMLGSAAMARKLLATGILKASPVWRGILASAAGEGTVSAGATAEGIRTQTEDGLLTAKQSAIAVGSGFGTSLFAVVGGRIANKLGIGDVDVFLGGGSSATAKGVIKRIIGGGISEGAFEELPQSMQEQMWLNAALDKPLLDGVAEAGAAGLLTGVAMGGGFGALQGRTEPTEKKKETAKDILLDETVEKPGATARDILTEEREPLPEEPSGAESLAAEEAAAAFKEEELEAVIPEKAPPKLPAEKPVWIDSLSDEAVTKRIQTLENIQKKTTLTDKQAQNLEFLKQEEIDRGIFPAEKPKEIIRDRKEEERLARAEREREEFGRPVSKPEPSAEEIKAGRVLEKEKADEAEVEKEPFEMDKAEYSKFVKGGYVNPLLSAWVKRKWEERGKPEGKAGTDLIEQYDKFGAVEGERRATIEQAIFEGKAVPQEVLKDYPDLAEIKPKAKTVPEKEEKPAPPAKAEPATTALDVEKGLKPSGFYKVLVTAPDGRFGTKVIEGGLSKKSAEHYSKEQKALGMVVRIVPELRPVLVKTKEAEKEIDVKAQKAATSPLSDVPTPTEAQIKAGTYKKGHISVQGFDISVENPDKSQRSGVDASGKKWSITMSGHYGYFKRSEGKDGEQIDVFVNAGDRSKSVNAYIVDQVDPKTGKFDEHKVMVGYPSLAEAERGYLANYEKGWKGFGNITEVTLEELKRFISKKQKAPFAEKEGLPTKKPVTEEAVEPRAKRDYQGVWDTKIKLDRKVDLVMRAGWVTSAGSLSKLGERIAGSDWKNLHPTTQETLQEYIADSYGDRKLAAIKSKAEPKLEGIDLSKIMVNVKAFREATGEMVTVKEKADVALAEIDDELETYYQMLACIE